MTLAEDDRRTLITGCGCIKHICKTFSDMAEDYEKICRNAPDVGDMPDTHKFIIVKGVHDLMMALGDIQNNFDCVTEDDEWMQVTFERMIELMERVQI